ncbi:MAG TPA: hypothetical protein VIR38_13040 [Thalassobaculum sp.]
MNADGLNVLSTNCATQHKRHRKGIQNPFVREEGIHNIGGLPTRTTIQPVSQADIERLYADPSLTVELSTAAIEHHIRRSRTLRARIVPGYIRKGVSALWRLVTRTERRSGDLTPSSA